MNRYGEKLQRMMSAVHLEPVDHIPFMSSGSAVNAAIMGVKLSDYCSDMRLNCRTNLEAIRKYSDPDGVQVTIFNPDMLTTCWLGKIELPGREIGENELWQMHETEIVRQEDYDEILSQGFGPWYSNVLAERLGNPLQYASEFLSYIGESIKIFAQNGFPCFCGANFFGPIEMFCGGRTLMNFFADDLIDIPDIVEQVFDKTQEFNLVNWENQLKNPDTRPIALWIGGWRGTPDLLSLEMFERFSWKYLKELAELCISYNVTPLFHLDSCWDRGLQYFRQLPKGKCILGFDGKTDIFKAKEVIGNHCCIMGDVPASILSFGTPEDTDAYCKRLVTELGPTGYILSSGCDAPYNAQLENLKVMADAVTKYRV